MNRTSGISLAAIMILALALLIGFGSSYLVAQVDPQRSDGPTIGPAPPGPFCPWVPHVVLMPAPVQCGLTEAGPKPGHFECGKNSACQDICIFKECYDP